MLVLNFRDQPANDLTSCYTFLMIKSELIRCLSDRFPALTTADAEIAVNLILEQISAHLSAGEQINIRGFGHIELERSLPEKDLNRKSNYEQ